MGWISVFSLTAPREAPAHGHPSRCVHFQVCSRQGLTLWAPILPTEGGRGRTVACDLQKYSPGLELTMAFIFSKGCKTQTNKMPTNTSSLTLHRKSVLIHETELPKTNTTSGARTAGRLLSPERLPERSPSGAAQQPIPSTTLPSDCPLGFFPKDIMKNSSFLFFPPPHSLPLDSMEGGGTRL